MKNTYFCILSVLLFAASLPAQMLDATISINGSNQLVVTINSPAAFQFNQAHENEPSLVIEDVYAVDPPALTTSPVMGAGISFAGSNGAFGPTIQMGPFGIDFGVSSIRDDEITFEDPLLTFSSGDIIVIEAGTIISSSSFSGTPPTINPGPYNAFIASDDYFSVAAPQVVYLPVELIGFSGGENGKHVYLDWETASETNNRGFEVEHSEDGENWYGIGFTDATDEGQSGQYRFIHESPANGNNYYRLKQYDYDGTFNYSRILQINMTAVYGLEVKPNPSSGWVQVTGVEEGEVTVLNAAGSVVMRGNLSAGQIDITDLPAGLFFLQILSEQKLHTGRVVKSSY